MNDVNNSYKISLYFIKDEIFSKVKSKSAIFYKTGRKCLRSSFKKSEMFGIPDACTPLIAGALLITSVT